MIVPLSLVDSYHDETPIRGHSTVDGLINLNPFFQLRPALPLGSARAGLNGKSSANAAAARGYDWQPADGQLAALLGGHGLAERDAQASSGWFALGRLSEPVQSAQTHTVPGVFPGKVPVHVRL